MNEPLLNEIKQFLFNEWDPIGLNKHPAANAEYDRYAPRIYRRLESGASANDIAVYLGKLEDGLRSKSRIRGQLLADAERLSVMYKKFTSRKSSK